MKTLLLLTTPIVLALVIAYMGKFGYYEIASQAYKKLVVLPREKINDLRANGKEAQKLPFRTDGCRLLKAEDTAIP